MDDRSPVKTSVEQISAYSLLLSEALFEALAKKGLLSHREVVEEISKLKQEMMLNRISFEEPE
jgi:hypothetical protein